MNIGVAAHITAAAPGGKRFDSALTPDERCKTENGIWLCQNCAKLIDSDDVKFSVGLLLEWKTTAESDVQKSIRSNSSLGFVPKGSNQFVLQVLPDEGEGDHAAEILCRLLESREDPAAFFQPTDKSLDNVTAPVCLFIELNGSRRPVLVLLRWNHWGNPQIQQVLVDPVGTVPLVAPQRKWPGNAFAFFIEKALVR